MSLFEIDHEKMPWQPLKFIKNSRSNVNGVQEFQSTLKILFEDARYLQDIATARQSANSAVHMKVSVCKICDHILVSNKLFSDAYTIERPLTRLSARRCGSFKITEMVEKNAVRLDLPSYMRFHDLIHDSWTRPLPRNRLRSWIWSQFRHNSRSLMRMVSRFPGLISLWDITTGAVVMNLLLW